MAFFCINCKKAIEPNYKACPHCGEQVTDFLRTYLGKPIDGKYEIISRLGVGGMGEVYKVLHVHLKSVRVVKLMRPNLTAQKDATERFLREARLATRINHPHVATLFDFATLKDGTHYMVWEYIEGTNLAQIMRRRGILTPHYAAKLSIDALLGLDAIHRAGIIHRDISPENMMITLDDDGDERVKIIDLGIAKRDDPTDDKTKTGVFVGKWKYCSPEHLGVLESGQRIDGRADLYSYGIVLFEMLTGRAPFEADSPHDYLVQHASSKPPSMSEFNPVMGHHPELEAIVVKALEKNRDDRFPTARQFANALRDILPSLESTDVTASDVEREIPKTMMGDGDTDEFTVPVPSDTAPGVHQAPTVTVPDVRAFAHETLDRAEQPEAQSKSRSWLLLVAAIIVVIAAGLGVRWYVKQRGAVTPPVERKAPPTAALVKGQVGVNAFPWGVVDAVRNVETGESVDVADGLTTPASIDLAPGRWEITFSNPDFPKPIAKVVDVGAGGRVSVMAKFADPAEAGMPDFVEALR